MISIPFHPRVQQREVYEAQREKRFFVLVCHRRWGKTVYALNWLQRLALSTPCPETAPFRGLYVAPVLKQAKRVAWEYMKAYSRPVPGVSFNESELRVDYPNGARLFLGGADNPDSYRGIYLDAVVADEVAQMPRSLFNTVLRPALADRKGVALFLGTPQGENYFFELYERARRGTPGWGAAMYRASETGILDEEELAQARIEMSRAEYDQEFECSFVAAIKGAYYSELLSDAERAGRITQVPYDPLMPVHTAWDLGMSDSTAIWFVQAAPGGAYRFIDYFEASGEGLAYYAEVLRQKSMYYGQHIGPHDIEVRELGTGMSRKDVAAGLGIRFDVCPRHTVQDGIYGVRAILPRAWFDADTCADGLKALRHYRREFKDKTGDFAAKPIHDWTSHGADAMRYFAMGFRERPPRPRGRRVAAGYDPLAY